MSEVKKPFRSGKCRTCHSEEYKGVLCPACEAYSNQDYVGRDELPIDEKAIDRRSAKVEYTLQEEIIKSEIKRVPSIGKILREASLTKQQTKIMTLNFVENLSWSQISLKLKISKGSVQRQMERALKKLHICHAETRSMKGKIDSRLISTYKNKVASSIDPYLYYSKCPKCGGTDFQSKANKGCCLGCGWIFTVHSVEEFQDSYEWPENPILDGSKY